MQRAFAILLLLAVALGASAGPHPCHAAAGPVSDAPSVAAHASCHGPEAAPKSSPKTGHDCCNPVKGGHILCDQACQATAVMGVAPAVLEILAFQELEVPLAVRSGALFVPSIDHVPLV